jgi:hypothetical protein
VTPEEIIQEALESQGVRLLPGTRWPVRLEVEVMDRYGRSDPGPHLVGRLDALSREKFDIRVTPKTRAGRDARELLREELLDVIFDDGAVRLVP